MDTQHQSVRDCIAARTTDGSEIADLAKANYAVPLAAPGSDG